MLFKVSLYLTLSHSLFINGVPQGSLSGRIVGGEEVDISEYPYQVAILYMNLHFCGGCLIADRWALTAAQCTNGFLRSGYQIKEKEVGLELGVTNRHNPRWRTKLNYRATHNHVYTVRAGTNFRERGGQVRGVIKVVNHPNHHLVRQNDFDVGLLQISHSFDPSPLIQPVRLPETTSTFLYPGDPAVVSGWGWEDPQGGPTDTLHATKIPIISKLSCEKAYGQNVLTDRMLCAGSPYGGRDACVDDAGGPLVVAGVVVGLVSWGGPCGSAAYPGVYSSVIVTRDWIKQISGV